MIHRIQSLVLLSALCLSAGTVTAQTFTTVAPGNWTSGSTWAGGVAPATDVDGKEIVIDHDVTVVNNDIKLIGGSTFVATNAHFSMLNGNFTVEDGSADFLGCQVVIADGFSIQITKDTGSLSMIGCEVEVGQNFQNSEGVRYLEDVCLTVNGSFQNAKGTDTLINVCALIGASTSGNFQNDSGSQMHIEASEFHLPNGNFQNQSSATLTGDITAIWLENGNLQNDGSWTAPVSAYCVSGAVTVSSTYLPAAEDCAGISSYFSPCDCSGNDVVTFCEGSPSTCPCGLSYPDAGCLNDSGGGARMSFNGSTSVAADDFTITASQQPANQFNLFFMARIASPGTPFGNGLLCVQRNQKILRFMPVVLSSATGRSTIGPGLIDYQLDAIGPPLGVISAGETWTFQNYFRDLGGCGAGFNVTNAIAVTFTP